MFHRLFLVCRNTSSLLFLLHLRHCWGASSLPSLEADVIQWVAEEGVGGEDGDEGGDGVGKEYCPGWDRHDAHSTAVTAPAAALTFPELHSHVHDLQNICEEFKLACIRGFQLIFQFLQHGFPHKDKEMAITRVLETANVF